MFDATQSSDGFFEASNALMTSYRYTIESHDTDVICDGWLVDSRYGIYE